MVLTSLEFFDAYRILSLTVPLIMFLVSLTLKSLLFSLVATVLTISLSSVCTLACERKQLKNVNGNCMEIVDELSMLYSNYFIFC